MNRNTSMLLRSNFDQFVKNSLSAGLRLLEENKAIALRVAINVGTESNIAHNFDLEIHLDE